MPVHDKTHHPPSDKLSRRKALRLLGLTAAVGYGVPAALMLSAPSPAEAWERTRRFRHRTARFRHRTNRFTFRERTRRFRRDWD